MRPHVVPDAPERACLYGRVSDVGGRSGEDFISPDVQEAAGRDHCAGHGLAVEHVILDLDQSGRNFRRRITEAIEGVEARLWDVIVVYRYDRFGRNVRDSLVNIARVEQAGGRVVSCTEPFDPETAVGRYGRTNLLAVAELQSDIIGENWKAAHARRLSRGLPHGGGWRFGYRYEQKRYVPDPDQADLAAELYRRYVAGQGLRPLADWLNGLGVRTRTKPGGWSHNGVASYLRTGFAAGLLHLGDGEYVDGAHDPIISGETWEAYLVEQRRRARTPRRLLGPSTPFSGLVVCGGCQRRMAHHGDPNGYRCDHRDCPNRAHVVRSKVETKVLGWLADYDADVTERARARTLSTGLRVGARAERRQLAREVTRLDRAMVQLTKDRASSGVPDGVYRQALAEFQTEHAAAQARLDELAETATVAPPPRATVQGLLVDWPILPVAARRGILAAMITVRVTRTGRRKHPRIEVVPRWEDSPGSSP